MTMKIKYLFFIIIFIISCNKNNKIDEITINITSEPLTIDPALNTDSWAASYMLHIFEGLTIKDENGNIIPGTAEKWDISDDGLIYTFYLRTNAKWSDGQPVTAHDFVYAWKRVVDPNVAAKFSYFMEPIENAKEIISGEKSIDELGVKAINDHILEVKLESPTPYFMELSSFRLYLPVRKDIIEKYGDNWTLKPETYIGNGAFKMLERKINEKITMVQNTNYWNIKNIKPKKLTFILMDDANASLASIKQGYLNFSKSLPRNNIIKLEQENIVQIYSSLATYQYRINVKKDILKNLDIRKALFLSIDRDYIINNITKAGEKPAYFLVSFGIKDYKANFRDNDKYYINKENNYSNDIIEAKKLMSKAGYSNGIGFPILELTIPNSDIDQNIAEAVQNMWKKILGIDVKINKYESGMYFQELHDRNFDIASYIWYADFNDPINFLNVFVSSEFANYGNYSNEKYDHYINISSITNNEENRMKILHEAENLLFQDVATIPIFYSSEAFLASPNLKGVEYDPMGMVKFHHAYLEE